MRAGKGGSASAGTLVVTGASTSGCVRANVVDAEYGDVVSVEEAFGYLKRVGADSLSLFRSG